jgi:hypothetical protein
MKLNITLPTMITGAALIIFRAAPPAEEGWLSDPAMNFSCMNFAGPAGSCRSAILAPLRLNAGRAQRMALGPNVARRNAL